jgi:hypothetical protein
MFLFFAVSEFQEQFDSALERSQLRAGGFLLSAEQIRR